MTHFIHYATACARHEQETESLVEYISLAVQMLTKSNANIGGGAFIDTAWRDMMHPHVEKQSAEEIVADVVERAGLTII